MNMKLIAGAVAVVVAGAGFVGWKQFGPLPAYKQAVIDQMRDPNGVMFRNERGDLGVLFDARCGEVNGKNALGGYGGWQEFQAMTDAGHTTAWIVTFYPIGTLANLDIGKACQS